MISHLFYHSEAVEEQCALNSWNSIIPAFSPDSEVIILDLGNTLTKKLKFKNIHPKYVRNEIIRTDKAEERSYTYGLNTMMPLTRFEWIIIWRSDYIYHEKYLTKIIELIKTSDSNIILPYECFIGAYYCDYAWAKKNFDQLTKGEEEFLIQHSTICPVYEMRDFPHFAIKKELWKSSNGMNEDLYGYGFQFPELHYRLSKLPDYKNNVSTEMYAFHQVHNGSFGLGTNTKQKEEELLRAKANMIKVFGSEEKANNFKVKIKQTPLYPKRPEHHYKLKNKPKRTNQLPIIKQKIKSILKKI